MKRYSITRTDSLELNTHFVNTAESVSEAEDIIEEEIHKHPSNTFYIAENLHVCKYVPASLTCEKFE